MLPRLPLNNTMWHCHAFCRALIVFSVMEKWEKKTNKQGNCLWVGLMWTSWSIMGKGWVQVKSSRTEVDFDPSGWLFQGVKRSWIRWGCFCSSPDWLNWVLNFLRLFSAVIGPVKRHWVQLVTFTLDLQSRILLPCVGAGVNTGSGFGKGCLSKKSLNCVLSLQSFKTL